MVMSRKGCLLATDSPPITAQTPQTVQFANQASFHVPLMSPRWPNSSHTRGDLIYNVLMPESQLPLSCWVLAPFVCSTSFCPQQSSISTGIAIAPTCLSRRWNTTTIVHADGKGGPPTTTVHAQPLCAPRSGRPRPIVHNRRTKRRRQHPPGLP